MEFTYNNNYQATIGMAPYKALYGRRCQTSVCWEEVGDRKLIDEVGTNYHGKGEDHKRYNESSF